MLSQISISFSFKHKHVHRNQKCIAFECVDVIRHCMDFITKLCVLSHLHRTAQRAYISFKSRFNSLIDSTHVIRRLMSYFKEFQERTSAAKSSSKLKEFKIKSGPLN